MSGFPPPKKREPVETSPYRESVVPASKPASVPCPFCSFEIDPSALRCPRCQVDLELARCPGCWTLATLGERSCGRCGAELPRLVSGEASDAPCPRCDGTLAPIDGGEGLDAYNACKKCGGVFLGHDALANAVRRRAAGLPLPPDLLEHVEPPADEVVYLRCPCCSAQMHRKRLARIVVDVCKRHGTWFDRGEVARVLAHPIEPKPEPPKPLAPAAKEAIARAKVEAAVETVKVVEQASFLQALLAALFRVPPV